MFLMHANLHFPSVFTGVRGPPAAGRNVARIALLGVLFSVLKRSLLDRFSCSWTPPGNLLAILRGPKMGPKSFQNGPKNGSRRGKGDLQFARKFSGFWRPGGGPRGPRIGLKRRRGGIEYGVVFQDSLAVLKYFTFKNDTEIVPKDVQKMTKK